jgi:hypothetical protein
MYALLMKIIAALGRIETRLASIASEQAAQRAALDRLRFEQAAFASSVLRGQADLRADLARLLLEQATDRELLNLIASNVVPPPRIVFTLNLDGKTVEGATEVDINRGRQFTLSAAGDFQGEPTDLVGTPTWESSDPSVATVTPDPDGRSAVVAATAVGSAVITCRDDLDPGDGVKEISGTFDVAVLPALPTSIVLTPGEVTDTPA